MLLSSGWHSIRFAFGVIAGLVIAPAALFADEKPDAQAMAFFEAKIRPVLVEHCYQCHSVKSGKSESGLLLDSRAVIRAGGDRGPAVVPGDPDASWLLTAISHADPDLKMPPKKERLPESVINDFRTWIKLGAADPREKVKSDSAGPPVTIEAGRQFWAFQKPIAHEAPLTRHPEWARRELDHFILAKLEAAGLTPSPDAPPATLLRRVHFDVIGLPPSPTALSAFLKRIETDGLDAALAAEVDALLASPQFGERWGRHWLDVARFAESSGKEANISFPYAFRYRDYVIDAVNADAPFDRFLIEQIAGDLLPYDDAKERARLLIATGFLALGPKNLDEGNPKQFAADLVDEQIDAVTRAVMANSVACARCHDHKFDPFAMQDYYALAGVFASTKTFFGTAVSPSNRTAGDPLLLPREAGQAIYHPSIAPKRVQELKDELAALKAEKITTLTDALRVFWKSGGIEGQLEKVDDEGRALPLAMGVLDSDKVVDAPLLDRGEVAKPGERVPRAFPRVVEIGGISVPSDHSGRREFARWLTHPDHPLTARVITNRVWRHLFRTGIVGTVDNFGFTGERPTHPELLDQLALQFVEGRESRFVESRELRVESQRSSSRVRSDSQPSILNSQLPSGSQLSTLNSQHKPWSIKKLVRELVLSRTYRQASDYAAAKFLVDPDNRLLWRASKRRLEAEEIRDAMLAVSGELDLARPGGSLVAKQIGDRPISLIGLDPKLPADLDGVLHRSVYLPVLRDRLPDVLDLFDFAEPSLVTGDREVTNVPVQALYLMNSPFVLARSQGLADRLLKEAEAASPASALDPGLLRRAYQLCLNRDPDEQESKMVAAFFERGASVSGDEAQRQRQLWIAYCQALLATAEFRNLD